MDLFHFQEEAPGSVFWHPNGWTLFQTLIAYMRRQQSRAGYMEVNSPDMMEKHLLGTFWPLGELRREHVYDRPAGRARVLLQADELPRPRADLQARPEELSRLAVPPIAEFGKVHRYEPSGALHGMLRVRHFTQDDAHIFLTEDQIMEECLKINDLMLAIYKDFGFEEVQIKLATRPEKRVGADEVWDRAEAALKDAMKAAGVAYTLNEGEGAFYGPKLEYTLRDAIGRDWQCGTVQVDLNMPERLGAFYIGADGEKHVPVMIHRAIFGSLERFTGILIENYAGHLPLWLAPVQAVVATVVSDADDYAREAAAALHQAGLRIETDLRNEKINYKVREHSVTKTPVLLVVGKREAEERTVSIRRLGSSEQRVAPLDKTIAELVAEATPPDLRSRTEKHSVPGCKAA